MSSILKALKKLEAEKSARRGEPVDLAREIARGESAAPATARQLPFLTITLALLAGAVIAIGAALLLWPRPGAAPAGTTQQAVTAPAQVQPQQTRTEPLPAADQPPFQPYQAAEQPKSVIPSPASSTGRPARLAAKPLPGPVPGGDTSQSKERPSTTPALLSPATQARTQPALQPLPAEPERKAAVPAATEPVRPTMVVSGIAWQKDSADRLAIVNGHPVAIGTTIDGAVVEEILQDRVRFSRDKQPFEILLGRKGN